MSKIFSFLSLLVASLVTYSPLAAIQHEDEAEAAKLEDYAQFYKTRRQEPVFPFGQEEEKTISSITFETGSPLNDADFSLSEDLTEIILGPNAKQGIYQVTYTVLLHPTLFGTRNNSIGLFIRKDNEKKTYVNNSATPYATTPSSSGSGILLVGSTTGQVILEAEAGDRLSLVNISPPQGAVKINSFIVLDFPTILKDDGKVVRSNNAVFTIELLQEKKPTPPPL